jgi:hypothetical protein
MPRSPLTALAASAAFLTCAAAGGAADASQPLRVLVYDVAYSTSTLRAEHTSGFTNGGTGSVAGSGRVDRRFGSDDRGTLTVAVVAATADSGLVVDVSLVGKELTQPVVRVAIWEDGTLSYDPKATLSRQAIGVLPFLARGFIAGRDVNPGSNWIVPPAKSAEGDTKYHVVSVEGRRATLEVQSNKVVRGAAGFAESAQGTAVYETDLISPVSLDLYSTVRRDVSVNEADTINVHLVATMVSDTFAKR